MAALLVVSASVTGAALAVAGARVLHAPALVAIVVLGSAAAGAAAAFALPLKLRDTPKRVTEPVLPAELERVVVRRWLTAAILLGIAIVALVVRLWHFNDVGYNSDEAVYAGQGAGIAHDPAARPVLPGLPRAPAALPVGRRNRLRAPPGRLVRTGSRDRVRRALRAGHVRARAPALRRARVGLIAAAVLALMPYHVIVSRQILLDGPQTFFTTITLCLADPLRALRPRSSGCAAAAAGMGLSVLAKEPSVIFCGAVYAFFALSPEIRVRPAGAPAVARRAWRSRSLPYPLALLLSGQTGTGGSFLAWQLVRQPNHSLELLSHGGAKLDRPGCLRARRAEPDHARRAVAGPGARRSWRAGSASRSRSSSSGP